MALIDDVQRKLQALLDDAKTVAQTAKTIPNTTVLILDSAIGRRWATKAEALLSSVFGPDSHFVRDLRAYAGPAAMTQDAFQHMWGVVAGAVDAWHDGCVFNLRTEAEAEVEGSLLGTAAHDLAVARGVNEPERRAAAVLAGSVLERHLRGLYKSRGGTDEGLTIEPLSVALKNLGAVDEVQRKQISSIGATRNAAAHDSAFTPTDDDVKRMIDSVTDMCVRLR